jgi:hypothetical protein
MKVDRVPKGKPTRNFATGGKQKMFGAGDRTVTKSPASPQRPGRTGQHSTAAAKRTGGRSA